MPNYVVNGVQVDPLVLAIPSSAFLIFLSKFPSSFLFLSINSILHYCTKHLCPKVVERSFTGVDIVYL